MTFFVALLPAVGYQFLKMNHLIAVILFLIPIITFSQGIDFSEADNHAGSLKVDKDIAISDLTRKLTMPFSSDLLKVRALFFWLADNIKYDDKDIDTVTINIKPRFKCVLVTKLYDTHTREWIPAQQGGFVSGGDHFKLHIPGKGDFVLKLGAIRQDGNSIEIYVCPFQKQIPAWFKTIPGISIISNNKK